MTKFLLVSAEKIPFVFFNKSIFVFKYSNKIFRKPILIIGLSLFLQVILGILTILSGVKIIYASLHQINSILIILSSLYFLYISKYEQRNNFKRINNSLR